MKTCPILPILTIGQSRREKGEKIVHLRTISGGPADLARSKPSRQVTISSTLRKNSMGRPEHHTFPRVTHEEKVHAGCSKSPGFSPAQPRRAKTLPSAGKAAASEAARRTLRYVEPLSEARTPLADFSSILL